MEAIHIKNDIITWITRLNDKKIILKLWQWVEEQKYADMSVKENILTANSGSLTQGYGIWAEDALFDETNYRDKLS